MQERQEEVTVRDAELELFCLRLVTEQITTAQSEEFARIVSLAERRVEEAEQQSRDLALRLDYVTNSLHSLNSGQKQTFHHQSSRTVAYICKVYDTYVEYNSVTLYFWGGGGEGDD